MNIARTHTHAHYIVFFYAVISNKHIWKQDREFAVQKFPNFILLLSADGPQI